MDPSALTELPLWTVRRNYTNRWSVLTGPLCFVGILTFALYSELTF